MSFASDVDRINKKLDEVLASFYRQTTLSVRDRVAARTPILTGRASASWNASVGFPDLSTKPVDYQNPNGAPMDGKRNLDHSKLGDDLYVSNGVPYINSLNAGSSLKAPAAFVETAVLETQLALPQIVSQVRQETGI